MKVIKNINNNISLCKDGNGRELIAFGKGIGFVKPPNDIPLAKIERTFYNIKDINVGIFKNMPTQIINLAIKITDMATNELKASYPSSIVLALADHIYYAIERHKDNVVVNVNLLEEIKQSYPKEIQLANKSIEMVNKELNITLPAEEVTTLAMHFIYDRLDENKSFSNLDTKEAINKCIEIVETYLMVDINREGFNCSRFITHIDYLIRRCLKNKQIDSDNQAVFENLKKEYANVYRCALKIADLINSYYDVHLNNEEIMYLMLHINRLCSRE